jgi:4-hydroxyphenylpyruvate dioxygenase-like putative hemolysin
MLSTRTFIFCVHYLSLIGRVYMFYVGHEDKSSLYETLFHCNILSKHHHPHFPTFVDDIAITTSVAQAINHTPHQV